MLGNCFEYKATTNDTCNNSGSGSGSIFVKYDHSAVTTAGGGNTNEPAWSFRLWNGSIYLSRYLESIAPELHDKTIIDLGSGTGLTSIVLGKYCGVRRVFATDLQHAMPLLSHNIAENFVSKSNLSEQLHGLPEPPNKSCPTCPASHTLIPVIADCEDYMCNVCDFDIVEDSCIHRCVECNFDICVKCMSKVASGDMASFPEWFRLQLLSGNRKNKLACTSKHDASEPTCPASHTLIPVIADCEDYMCNVCDFDIVEDSCIHRCVECNFDICVKCMSKVASGDMASFPEWFRLQLQSNAPREVDSGAKVVIPCVYDWSSKDSLVEFVNEISTVNECDDMRVQYLVGADVTYSLKSIDLFFAAVVDLTATLRAKSTCAATTPSETTLLFSHHNRSDDTNEYMLNQLRLNFEGRYEVIQFQELGREDREDSANDLTGDMAIYRVQL